MVNPKKFTQLQKQTQTAEEAIPAYCPPWSGYNFSEPYNSSSAPKAWQGQRWYGKIGKMNQPKWWVHGEITCKNGWLVVWNMNGLWLSHHIGNVIIPTDELIFFRGVETTNQRMEIPRDLGSRLWWFSRLQDILLGDMMRYTNDMWSPSNLFGDLGFKRNGR